MKAILTTKIKRKKVIKYENLTRNKKIEWIAYLTPNGDYDQRKQSLFIEQYLWSEKKNTGKNISEIR